MKRRKVGQKHDVRWGCPSLQLITDAAIDEVRAAHEERHAIRPGPKQAIVYVSKPPPPPPAPEPAQQPSNPIYGYKNTG